MGGAVVWEMGRMLRIFEALEVGSVVNELI